jgi:hypothetical protein
VTLVLMEAVTAGLRELSDVAYQRRVWAGRGSAGEMSSFEEAVSTLFDDSGLEAELERGRPVFGPDVDAQLRSLRSLLQRIDPYRDPDLIIDDPLMGQARQRAASILEVISEEDHNASP